MSHNDTIVAQATPPGRGGVGILRISGLKARDVAQAVLGKLPKPRYADYLPFNDVDGTPLDQGIALWFPGPNSFTGEDVLELQGHGGPVILDLLLKRILTLPGLRIARPGEFSERAFLICKCIYLTQLFRCMYRSCITSSPADQVRYSHTPVMPFLFFIFHLDFESVILQVKILIGH